MNKVLLYGGGLTLCAVGALTIIIGIHGIEIAIALIRED